MKTQLGGLVAGLALLAGLGTAPAHAVPTLRFSADGGAPTECADGAGCDSNGADGVVSFAGSVGVFDVSVTIGETKPVLLPPELVALSATVMQTGTAEPHTLKIQFSETGFTSLGPISAQVGGSLTSGWGEFVVFRAYFDGGNDLFAETTQIGSGEGFSTGPFSGSFGGTNPAVTPYSLTQTVSLTTGDSLVTLDFDFSLEVPEPTTLALLGLGLAGLAATRRRK